MCSHKKRRRSPLNLSYDETPAGTQKGTARSKDQGQRELKPEHACMSHSPPGRSRPRYLKKNDTRPTARTVELSPKRDNGKKRGAPCDPRPKRKDRGFGPTATLRATA